MSKTAPAPWLILLWGVCAVIFATTETIAIIDGTDGTDLTRHALNVYGTLRALCLTAAVIGVLVWNRQDSRRAPAEPKPPELPPALTPATVSEAMRRAAANGYVEGVRGRILGSRRPPAPPAHNH